MDWTDQKEMKLKKILTHSYLHSWIHTLSSNYCESVDFGLAILISIVNVAMGTTLLATVQSTAESKKINAIQIIFAIVNVGIGVILTIRQYTSYPKKIDLHKNMSIEWLLLSNKLEYCLSLPRNQRTGKLLQYDYLNNCYGDLIGRKIGIPSSILRRFQDEFHIDFLKINMYPNIDEVIDVGGGGVSGGGSGGETVPRAPIELKHMERSDGLRLQEEFEQRLKKINLEKPSNVSIPTPTPMTRKLPPSSLIPTPTLITRTLAPSAVIKPSSPRRLPSLIPSPPDSPTVIHPMYEDRDRNRDGAV